jgi:peptidylprolyl isomerase
MRNYNEWLAFTVGAWQMIAGFDKGVEGMKIWQTKTVTIPAKEAYGEWSEKNMIEVERAQLPEGEYEKGMKLSSAMGQTFTVQEVKEKSVILDANHELAWKDLIFDITLVEIK